MQETLIENINFEVHEHDYLCIVGENWGREKHFNENITWFS